MRRVTIRDKQRPKIFSYVTSAVNKLGSISYLRDVYILGNLINIVGFPFNNDQKRGLIKKGLARFSRYRRRNLGLFLRALEAELKSWERARSSRFFVVFPLNITYNTLKSKRFFVVDGIKLKTRSFAHVMTKYKFKRPYSMLQTSREIPDFRRFTYLEAEIYARTQDDAFRSANKRVELQRSLINFILSYRMLTYQLGRPSPLSKVDPPRYMFVFDEKRSFLGYWGNVGEFRYRLVDIQPSQLKGVKRIVKDLEKMKHCKLKSILVECFILYGYALDEIERGYTFLHLWQILELVALKEASGISLDKVKKRIKSIFKGNVIVSDVLDALFNKRNQLVHEGRLSDFSLHDVNQIKGIAEGCMDFLFNHVNKLQTKENLHTFYDNIGLSKKRVNSKLRVLSYVKKL